MNNSTPVSFGSFQELFTSMVKQAVAEALQEQHAQERPCYPEWVSVEQASEITLYSKNSLYQMHLKGKVPGAKKVGGKLVFNTATLRKWVEEGGKK